MVHYFRYFGGPGGPKSRELRRKRFDSSWKLSARFEKAPPGFSGARDALASKRGCYRAQSE